MPANPNPNPSTNPQGVTPANPGGPNPTDSQGQMNPNAPGPHTPDQSEAIEEQRRQQVQREGEKHKGDTLDLRDVSKPVDLDEPEGDIELVLKRDLIVGERTVPAGQKVRVTKAFFARAIAPHPDIATTPEAHEAQLEAKKAFEKAQRLADEAASKVARL